MRKIQATFLNVLITYVVTLLKFVEIIRIGFFLGNLPLPDRINYKPNEENADKQLWNGSLCFS